MQCLHMEEYGSYKYDAKMLVLEELHITQLLQQVHQLNLNCLFLMQCSLYKNR